MNLIKNSTIVIIGVVVANLLAYVFHFVAGRMLGPEDYGVFGALMALFIVFSLPASALGFAVTKFTSRYVAEQKPGKIAVLRRKIQNNVLVFSAVMFLFIVFLSQSIADYLNIDSNIPVIIVGITLVFALILPVNRGLLQGMKKFLALSWNSVIESFARLLFLIVFLFFGFGVNGAILSYGLANFVAFLLIFPFIKEIKETVLDTERIEIRPIYTFIFQVLVINLIIQSIINLPSLFIKHYFSSEFAGYWTAALNIARISLFITSAISMVMFPEIAGEKDQHKKRIIFGRAALLVLLASSGAAILFLVIPQFLIQSLYGIAYLGAVPILQWMGIAMIFIGMLQLWADYFFARIK